MFTGGKLQETDKLKTPEIIIHSLGNYLKMRFSQILFCAYMNLQNWCHTVFFFFFSFLGCARSSWLRAGISLVRARDTLAVELWLFIMVASLVAEHRL